MLVECACGGVARPSRAVGGALEGGHEPAGRGHGGGTRAGLHEPVSRPHRSPHRLTAEAGAAVADLTTGNGCRPVAPGAVPVGSSRIPPRITARARSLAEPNRPSTWSSSTPRGHWHAEDGTEVEQVMKQRAACVSRFRRASCREPDSQHTRLSLIRSPRQGARQ